MSLKGHEYIKDVRASAKSLAALVDTLLNVSRLEDGGGVAVVSEDFGIVELTKNFIAEMQMFSDRRKIKVMF